MQKKEYKAAKITAVPGKGGIILQSLLYELEDDNGHVFALYKILGRKNQAREHIAITINEHIERFRHSINSDANIARRFEHLLQALNEGLESVSKEIRPVPITDIHAVVGVVSKGQLFISGVGKLSANFMHRTAKSRYTIYELDAQFEPPEKTSWDKLFVTVLDGELHAGDIFYLASRIPSRELSQNELQDILVTLPAQGALGRIQQYRGSQEAYGAVLLKMEEEKISTTRKKVNPVASMEQLGQTKDQTAELLGDQKTGLSHALKKVSESALAKLAPPGNKGAATILGSIARFLVKTFIGFMHLLVKAFKFTWQFIVRSAKRLNGAYRENRETITPKQVTKSVATSVQAIPKNVKIFGASIAVLCIIGVIGWRVMARTSANREATSLFTSVIESIEEKRDTASAVLIYDDNSAAETEANEALALLDSLDVPKGKQEEVDALRQEIIQILNDVRGVEAVELEQVASSNENHTFLVQADGDLYAITENGIPARFDSVNGVLQSVDASIGTIGNPVLYTNEGNAALLLDPNRQLGRFDPATSSVVPIISGTNRLNDISAAATYLDNLYVFSPVAQQIIRMRAQGAGYEAGTPWISARDSDLSNVIDLAIDGNIYALAPDRIFAFNSGRETSFNLEPVQPRMTAATAIQASVDSDFIHIFEPEQGRVLVYRKNGELVRQYANDRIKEATDFYVDLSSNTIFVLIRNTLHSFPASHLAN